MTKDPLTRIQVKALDLTYTICKEFEHNRWITIEELPTMRLHTPKALIERGFFEQKILNGVIYYRLLKERLMAGGQAYYRDIASDSEWRKDADYSKEHIEPLNTAPSTASRWVVLEADGIRVIVEHPDTIDEKEAIAIANEFIGDEFELQSTPEWQGAQ